MFGWSRLPVARHRARRQGARWAAVRDVRRLLSRLDERASNASTTSASCTCSIFTGIPRPRGAPSASPIRTTRRRPSTRVCRRLAPCGTRRTARRAGSTTRGESPSAPIPWMKEKIAKRYPGTKLTMTEYDFGGAEHISGGLAQADVLGVFGREGVFLANYWGNGPGNGELPSYIAAAFRLFRNYDGSGGTFGDTAVTATAPDVTKTSVFAAVDSKRPNLLTVLVINKDPRANYAGHVTLQGATQYAAFSGLPPRQDFGEDPGGRFDRGARQPDRLRSTSAFGHALRLRGALEGLMVRQFLSQENRRGNLMAVRNHRCRRRAFRRMQTGRAAFRRKLDATAATLGVCIGNTGACVADPGSAPADAVRRTIRSIRWCWRASMTMAARWVARRRTGTRTRTARQASLSKPICTRRCANVASGYEPPVTPPPDAIASCHRF